MTPVNNIPGNKQESWSRLNFFFEKGCVLHSIQYNDSRISYFPAPVNLSLPFLLLVIPEGVLCPRLYDTRY